jgi:hypothetical protein
MIWIRNRILIRIDLKCMVRIHLWIGPYTFNNIAPLKSIEYVESEVILHATRHVFCNDTEKTKTKVRVDLAVSLPIGDPCSQPLAIHVHNY